MTKSGKRTVMFITLGIVLLLLFYAVFFLKLFGDMASRRAREALAVNVAEDAEVGAEPISALDLETYYQGIENDLQEQTDASVMRFSVETRPVFENGEAEGAMFIDNQPDNPADIKVVIYLDESGEAIYESPLLSPGDKVLTAKLTKTLAQGEYQATAHIASLDRQSGAQLAGFEAEMLIEIQS